MKPKFTKRGILLGTMGSNMVKSINIENNRRLGIVSGELYSGDVFVYRNNGNFNFSEVHTYKFEQRIFAVETGDFDADSLEDFVVSKAWDKIYVFRNQGKQIFDIKYTGTSTRSFFNMLAYDLNKDSRKHLIITDLAHVGLEV